jgi:hypothetical protein
MKSSLGVDNPNVTNKLEYIQYWFSPSIYMDATNHCPMAMTMYILPKVDTSNWLLIFLGHLNGMWLGGHQEWIPDGHVFKRD